LIKKKAQQLAKKVQKGKGFDLQDFKEQLEQMRKMGGMMSLMDKLPGMGNMSAQMKDKANDKQFVQMEAIINSMTPAERARPDVIKGSRKKRIAAGSGTQIQDVNRLLKQFTQMQKMMKKMSGGGMKKMMRNMQGMMPPGGGMPPGMGGMFGRK
jgi:signal recognition particle subunit SRP54